MSQDQYQKNNNSTDVSIHCDETLDIRQVSDLKLRLLQALDAAQSITLQAQNIERADTAGLQLLAAFFIDARAKGIPIAWQQPSQALVKAANLIGLAGLLDLAQREA